jgi:hypothetical protein
MHPARRNGGEVPVKKSSYGPPATTVELHRPEGEHTLAYLAGH